MKITKFLLENPSLRILDAASKIELKMNLDLSAHSLNISQSLMLVALFSEEGRDIRSKELSAVFGLTKGAISQGISHLESLGLIKRKADLKDRQGTSLQMTDKGRNVSLKLVAYFEKSQQKVERTLSSGKVSRFLSTLEAVTTPQGHA